MSWKTRILVSALGAAVASSMIAVAAFADDDLLKTIKDRGVMRVCDVEYLPWNMKNPITNQWEGANIDIGNEIAALLKVKIEHVDSTWATLIPSMTTKKCDFALTGVYLSAARAELVSFTRPFAQDGVSLFIPGNSTAKSVADLDQPGKVIAARAGALEDTVAKQTFKKATVKTITADGSGVAVLEVAAGRADAAAGGYYGNIMFLKQNANLKVKPLGDILLTRTPMAYPVPAREYFLRDYLNTVLTILEENGELKKIVDKWSH